MKRVPQLQNLTFEKLAFPREVVVETTSFCNLRCTFCAYKKMTREKGEMAFDTFKKIVDEMVKESPSSRLWVAILGEPLLSGDRLIRMLQYAHDSHLENINLNTNAMYLDEKMAEKILAIGIKNIIISLDAHKKETYEQVRVGGKYDVVVKNIERFLDMKRAKNLKSPDVTVQFIVMDENENEFEDFKKHWLSKGARVKARLKMGWGDAVPAGDLEKAAVERDFPCPWIIRAVSIQWDGKLAQCDADYDGKYSPGDLAVNSIKEIWDGEHAKRREKHWNLNFDLSPCDNCLDWSVGRSTMFYPDNDPAHANS